MNASSFKPNEYGVSLIELIIATSIVAIAAAMIIPAYSTYRMRTQRLNAESCLLNLARQQENYFVRHGRYVTDLKILGYNASHAATCTGTDQYQVTAIIPDSKDCTPDRCYQLSAVPLGTQAGDDTLYLRYDASKSDASQRFKKERGNPGSGKTWN